MVAPPLPYGSSGEHAGFPGTLVDRPGRAASSCWSSSRARGTGRCCSSARTAGNAEPLAAAVRKLRIEGREVRAWSPAFGGDAHAGRVETSLMLALAPERGRSRTPGGQRRAAGASSCRPCARAACGGRRRTACSATPRARAPRRAAPSSPARSPTSSRSSMRGGLVDLSPTNPPRGHTTRDRARRYALTARPERPRDAAARGARVAVAAQAAARLRGGSPSGRAARSGSRSSPARRGGSGRRPSSGSRPTGST